MKLSRLLPLCLLLSSVASAANTAANAAATSAEPVKFLRYPHVSNEGAVAFCYHGDIWISDLEGAAPRRLTDHVAPDTFPRFSPDGKWVAFTSTRFGNSDLFVMPAAGGEARQITFNSIGDNLLYWTPDGERLLFASSRGKSPWGAPLYTVDLQGGLPEPLDMDRGALGMLRQDGAMIAFNRVGFRYWRKHYRGNNNTDVWVQDLGSGELRQLTDLDPKAYREHTQDAYPMWGADGRIYFMSERGGAFDLWRVGVDGAGMEQVTHQVRDGVQYPAISPDGRRIVYESDFELWVLDVDGGEPRRIPIDLEFDDKANQVTWAHVEDEVDGFAPSPDGEQVAVDVQGELFLLPADPDFGEKVQVTDSPWRDRRAQYAPDGASLAWISDASGEEELWLRDLETGRNRKLTTHASPKGGFLWSNDSASIAFDANNSLMLLDVASAGLTELAHNDNRGFRLSSFSADDHWLVYSRSDADLDSEVYLFELASRREINVSAHPARDGGGVLTPDGETLVFTSDRGGETQVYALSLSRMSEDPDDPLVRARERDAKGERGKKGGEDEDGEDEDGDGENESGEEAGDALELTIDLEGIDRRPRRLTSGGSSSGAFLSKDGQTVYYLQSEASSDGGGGRFRGFGGTRKLMKIDLAGREAKEVGQVSGRGVTPTADRSHVFFSDGGKVMRLALKGGKPEAVPVDLTVRIDQRERWEQQFEEAWRVMKYRFYDPEMHGMDWAALKAHYKPMLRYVGQNQDLYDLCNEMIGELNASHTGVSGPGSQDIERAYSTRQLGVELEAAGAYYAVSHVYRDGPADKEWLDLSVGDYVLAIDGQPLRAGDNYWHILNHTLNDYVSILVASPATPGSPGASPYGEQRGLRVRAISSLRGLKYEEWVHSRRELVDELSGGKIGYVHIQSMNQSSLERFEQEIDRYWNKNGMVIDIRFNGGGNTDQQLIDILERRPYEYWNSRWGGRAAGRRPRQCIAGPKVMLINWRSASDSEVTPQAFRDLELGRIVGNPTYGAVIATGSYGLLGGARIRTPGALVVTYDPSQPNNYGINLENYGVPPDVWVENSPQDELAGRDRELEVAVQEALDMLAEGDWQFGEDGPPVSPVSPPASGTFR